MNLKNTTLSIIGILFVGFLFVITPYINKATPPVTHVPNQTNNRPEPASGWNRFTNPASTWSIDTASTSQVIINAQQMSAIGYIPTCDPETATLCVFIPKETVPNSNFQGAAVSVNVFTATTSQSCLSKNSFEQIEASITTINSVPFQTFTVSDAAMSHQSSGIDYRAWYEGICYGIQTRINTTSFEVYETGTIQKFTDTERAYIQSLLTQTVSTFMFL